MFLFHIKMMKRVEKSAPKFLWISEGQTCAKGAEKLGKS